MFSFLNSTVLFAAAAALIPLIIHLFSRRRRKVVEFSSLRHLKAMQRRQVRRLQIRQLLLLILRMLIILMAVLAFARPTTKDGDVGTHAAVSAVVLLDNSASMDRYMQDGTLFEIARKRTQELLETFNQSDRVCLVTLCHSGEFDRMVFSSPAVALEQLKRAQISSGLANMPTAMEHALELLSNAKNLNREIYFVTDRQRRLLPEEGILEGSGAEVYFVDLPSEESENRGIISVDFGGQLMQPGHDFDLVATVRNYSNQPAVDLIASSFLNGLRVAQTDFSLPASGESSVRFTHSISRTGYHSGYIEISDDKFMVDNRYYFSFRIPDRFNLLLIDGDEAAQLIALALTPDLGDNQYWSVKTATPQELAGVKFNDYDVVMLVGAPELDRSYVTRLINFVRRGKSLFVSYGDKTDIESFNRTWTEATGVMFEEPVKRSFTRAGYYGLQTIDINHPIFSVFEFENDQPPSIKFFTLPRVRVNDSARVVMSFTGDRPALVEKRFGSGKVLTFAGPLAPYYSDLTSHGFFVPFVSRIAEYLASDLSVLDINLFTEDNITRTLSLAGSVHDPVDLITPDSSVFFIPPEEEHGALVINAEPTDQAGIYSVKYRGREIDRFAANINPGECDLTQVDNEQFASALGSPDYRLLTTDVALAAEISVFRVGRELWQLFLWIAVLLLVVEMLLGRASTKDTPSAES